MSHIILYIEFLLLFFFFFFFNDTATTEIYTLSLHDALPISVGYQSGSHYSTIQQLEQYLPADKINLSYADGMLFKRMELLLDRKAPASALFSGPYYLAEQLGFRKIIDTTFMITTMISGNPDPEDLRKFF